MRWEQEGDLVGGRPPHPEEWDEGRGGGAGGRVKQQEVEVEAAAEVMASVDAKEEARLAEVVN
jgi:hypothetical protein